MGGLLLLFGTSGLEIFPAAFAQHQRDLLDQIDLLDGFGVSSGLGGVGEGVGGEAVPEFGADDGGVGQELHGERVTCTS
jgi:hypothetical protein